MKSLDLLKQKKVDIMNRLNQAMKEGNEEAFAQTFTEFTEYVQEVVMEEAKGLVQAADTNVLVGRGVRQLTSEENKYFQKVIEAMSSSNPKQALTEIEITMPKTIIDSVFEDLTTNHPLLDAINFQNTSGLIEFLVNSDGDQIASWGTLTSEIVK
ncbi:hypothetical protein [Clostridium intestinale]|uniref:Phage major capsid protein, HK97 family n=2 Tax=Clostridium TaxID=1485 RepID=A0A1M5U0N2_9CLOT|nr:hypothetical protein [Clostridium intestinale]SHH56518.1 phage major capsid protein, HK97 family [Clostridium intestinale DSM 6191]